MLGCPGEVWGGIQTHWVSWAEVQSVGWCVLPQGQVAGGSQSLQWCPDVPVLCAPIVAANVAPTFLPNMTSVTLPEDLPVGE